MLSMDNILLDKNRIFLVAQKEFAGFKYNQKSRIASLHKFLLICFSLTFGYVLQSLPLLHFLDRQNYLNYAENSVDIWSRYAADGFLTLFANEPLWLLANISIAHFFEPDIVLRIIIFFGAYWFSYSLIRVSPKNSIWLMLFLLAPQILKNHITHLRQGLAMALFFSGYFLGTSRKRWLLMAASPFVHASFFFILPIIILPRLLKRLNFAIDVRITVVGVFAVVATVSLGLLAAFFSARQAGYGNFGNLSVSGLGLVFWVGVAGLFLSEGRKYIEANQEALSVLFFYFISYFIINVSARIFESSLPIVLFSGLLLTAWRRWVFICAFLLYSIMQWILRLSLPTVF